MSKQIEVQGEVPGIYLSEHQMNNMTMERIVVSNPAIITILENVKLSEQAQLEAIDLLVDRTPDWLEYSDEDQVAKIQAVLTQETVIEYLNYKGIIREKVDVVQTGIDQEGSIVIEAYYTKLNREQRRMMEKAMTDKVKQRMAETVNILSGDDKLIDLAAKKLEKLQKQGKLPKKK